MGGPIHYITSDGTGTKIALAYGTDIAIMEQYAICALSLTFIGCDRLSQL